mmetsp:Transcript_21652/g.53715  ORF Transcript_21652/g.53715 Transcript_21652/m.53715 type:complete len:321 (+) Transcript_21652:278-1240(+)
MFFFMPIIHLLRSIGEVNVDCRVLFESSRKKAVVALLLSNSDDRSIMKKDMVRVFLDVDSPTLLTKAEGRRALLISLSCSSPSSTMEGGFFRSTRSSIALPLSMQNLSPPFSSLELLLSLGRSRKLERPLNSAVEISKGSLIITPCSECLRTKLERKTAVFAKLLSPGDALKESLKDDRMFRASALHTLFRLAVNRRPRTPPNMDVFCSVGCIDCGRAWGASFPAKSKSFTSPSVAEDSLLRTVFMPMIEIFTDFFAGLEIPFSTSGSMGGAMPALSSPVLVVPRFSLGLFSLLLMPLLVNWFVSSFLGSGRKAFPVKSS